MTDLGALRPPRPIRLVATDLDGTLLRADYTVSARTRRVFDRVRSSGAEVILVTGRPPRWVHGPIEESGARGPVVCANGALVYDPRANTIVSHHPLDPSVAAAIISGLRDAAPQTVFACEIGLRFGRESAWDPLDPPPDEIVVPDALALLTRPVTKLLALHPSASAAQLAAVARPIAGDAAEMTWSTNTLLEVSGRGVTKASALADICGQRGIPADAVVAFGDMPNDLAMLRWAGLGIAVANAHPEVLAQADAVTATNHDDGVAVALERLFVGGGPPAS